VHHDEKQDLWLWIILSAFLNIQITYHIPVLTYNGEEGPTPLSRQLTSSGGLPVVISRLSALFSSSYLVPTVTPWPPVSVLILWRRDRLEWQLMTVGHLLCARHSSRILLWTFLLTSRPNAVSTTVLIYRCENRGTKSCGPIVTQWIRGRVECKPRQSVLQCPGTLHYAFVSLRKITA
jgi:hypothetical protein